MNYERDINIDPMGLDIEWIRQPELFRKYASELEEAKDNLRITNEKKKTIRSQLILEVHRDPDHCLGLGVRPSDPKAEAYYRSHKEYKEIIQEVLEYEKEVGLLDVAVRALHMKKYALESLVKLMGQQYFAGPKIAQDLKGRWDEYAKENVGRTITKKQISKRKDRKNA